MKRKDMQKGVLYAIERTHHSPRPGFVLDPGTPPAKVKACVYWSWDGKDGREQDYLETDPDIIAAGKYDECEVGTGQVLMTWTEFVAGAKAMRAAKLAEQQAEEAERAARKAARVARATAAASHLDGLDIHVTQDLVWSAEHGYPGERRFSVEDVCIVIEYLTGGRP